MKLCCYLLALSFCIFASAQKIEFSPNDYDDPAIFEKGQNAPHAVHIPFNSSRDALQNDVEQCENFQLLNGTWKFKWVERPDLVHEDFGNPNFDTRDWDEITVPSNWQMEGFGHPKFRNIALSFESDPPHIPFYYNPTGCYKRTFNVPDSWEEKEVMLRFEGIKSASYVWINGEKVGYNQGGFEPAEYNISSYIKKDKNDISIKVIRFSDGSYLENQDMWRLSGIYRDVKLIALPKAHIHDCYYYTDLDEEYQNAQLNIEFDISNSNSSEISNYSVSIDVLGKDHKSILNENISTNFNISEGTLKKLNFQTLVDNPLKWSAEYPKLYILLVELKDNNGNTIEAFTKKIGFREVEMNGEVVLVNGVPVKLNGVNSHMHHPVHGQAVPLETLRKDLLIMKQFNINSVRTCHYPPTPEYLEMADELGIYIVDEVGDEAHANIQLSYDTTYTEMYRDRSRKLVYRDRNHVSVLMWSAGNESGSGPNIQEVIKTGKAIDPSRPAWMYGGNTFYIPFEDVIGPRYWVPYQLKNLAERKTLGENDLRSSFMDEYLAATGNGLGGLDEYWELIWRYPRLMGGAIWDWISPGITTIHWTTPDASVKKNDGTIMGRPEFVDGYKDRALAFSGHDDWVEFYRDKSIDITGNQLTISFWVKPKEIPQPNSFITKGIHGYGIRMDSPNTLEFYVTQNNLEEIHQSPYYDNLTERIAATAEVPDNWYDNWHHITGIYDGAELKLFINKQLVAETVCSGNIAHTPFSLCIGREAETQDQGEHSGRLSSMLIDEVKIYNKAVSFDVIESDEQTENMVLSLPFEEDAKGEEYFNVGLGGRTYGIIWPDRKLQPEIYQIKKSGQPISVKAVNLEKGIFKVINRHHFKDLSEFNFSWELMLDGKLVEEGEMETSLAAQNETEISIPFVKPANKGECILTTSFTLKETTNWASSGHEVAFDQFIVENKFCAEKPEIEGEIAIKENNEQIIVSGENFTYSIDRMDGKLSQLTFQGYNYLDKGPLFNVWRVPTANDTDPWGSYLFSEKKKTIGQGRSIDNQLRSLGMRDLQVQVDNIEAIQINNSTVVISIQKFYNSSNMRGSFECLETYTFLADGTIDIQLQVNPHGVMPDMLPKVGWQFGLPKSMRAISWYGRGFFESYPDRKTGAKIGIYESTIDDEYVPYIIPQDYGNHTDVRWVKLQDDSGHGLVFSSDDLLNFSYHKFSTDNLSRAYYTYQLKEAETNILNIDFEVSGVGGTAVRQLEKYKVKPEIKEYTFYIKPF